MILVLPYIDLTLFNMADVENSVSLKEQTKSKEGETLNAANENQDADRQENGGDEKLDIGDEKKDLGDEKSKSETDESNLIRSETCTICDNNNVSDEDDITICKLCDKSLTKPKCLPCVHSFCESCLGSYILEHANEENRTDSSFQCPVCRTVVVMPELSIETWINLLPNNRLLINLVEKISLQKATTCEPCKRGQEEKDAVSWCKDCGEALCEQCTVYHQRMKLLMEHTVLNLEEIKQEPIKLADTEDICPNHGGKFIEAFCHDHEKLCCVECVTDTHRKCHKVTPLDDAANNIQKDKRVTDLSQRLVKVDDDAIAVITSRNVNIENLSRRQDDILDEIAALKREINEHLDQIEEKIKEEFSIMHRALVEELKIQRQDFECLHKSIDNGQKVLKASLAHGTDRQIFITAHRLKKLCEEHEWYIKSESGKIYHLEYDLDLEKTLQTLTKNIPSVARISVKKYASNLVPAFMKDMQAIDVGEVNGRCQSDKERCWFTGGAFLPNGDVIFADYKNSKLKRFNKSYELVIDLALEGKPWDVALFDSTHIVVSFPDDGKMAFVTLNLELDKGTISNVENSELDKGSTSNMEKSELDTNDKSNMECIYVGAKPGCHGVVYCRDNIVAACSNQIRFISKEGVLESSIDIGERGSRHIHSTNDSRLVYSTKAAIVCMSMEGEDIFQYSSKDLRSPRGVATDKEGNYYVCGMDSNNVHQLDSKGKLVKILLGTKDGINNPYAVGFEKESTRMFVTQMDCDTVKFFKLVTKW